jgi:hypothetical protein
LAGNGSEVPAPPKFTKHPLPRYMAETREAIAKRHLVRGEVGARGRDVVRGEKERARKRARAGAMGREGAGGREREG